MPFYEYRCEQGHTFEVMQRMSDEPLATCTTCHAAVQRVFHPVAVHFKGSGFYNTDYGKSRGRRDDSGANGSESKGSDGGAQGESSGGGSDTTSSSSQSTGAAGSDSAD